MGCTILDKYVGIFPSSFIRNVNNGANWLVNHANLNYKTNILVTTSDVVYEATAESLLQIGLIDTNNPLKGLKYYDVQDVTELIDEDTQEVTYSLKVKYVIPIEIVVVVTPVKYFNYNEPSLTELTSQVEAIQKEIALIKEQLNQGS